MVKMSGRQLNGEDHRELGRLLKVLAQKLVQVIVQSRLGEKAATKSKIPEHGSEWFNLSIEDIPEIHHEMKRSLGGDLPDVGRPLVIEILLRTPEADSLVLEIWTLSILDASDTSPARINPTIYNRMTVLLKSCLSVTRITPAYKLSFRQGADSFVICYRVYLGDPNYDVLGENRVLARVGQLTTPETTIALCVNYRTEITLAPQVRSPAHDAIMLKSDHFKPEASPRHCRRLEKGNDPNETATISDESQDAQRLFTTSPPDLPSTPRSRANSDCSGRGNQQQHQPERKISVAFVDAKPPNPEDFCMPDVPFSSLFASTIEPFYDKKKELTSPIKSNIAQDKTQQIGVAGLDGGALTASDCSHKSTCSTLKEEAGFVMVELKTPFGDTSETGSDLGAFYRECQTAPPLRLFAESQDEDICNLTEQLKSFEANMDDYEDLVKSLHEDSPNNTD